MDAFVSTVVTSNSIVVINFTVVTSNSIVVINVAVVTSNSIVINVAFVIYDKYAVDFFYGSSRHSEPSTSIQIK